MKNNEIKLTTKTLLSVLSPETIADIDPAKLEYMTRMGEQNSYFLTEFHIIKSHMNREPEQKSRKIMELSQGRLAEGLSEQEKCLFASKIRFYDNQIILDILKNKRITKNDIVEMNALIKNFQNEQISFTLKVIGLEKKYDLKVEQVAAIMKLCPSMMNTGYQLNDADKQIYSNAQKFYMQYKLLAKKKEHALKALNNNSTIQTLAVVAREYFCFTPEQTHWLINKINELMVICPELIADSKQKKLK